MASTSRNSQPSQTFIHAIFSPAKLFIHAISSPAKHSFMQYPASLDAHKWWLWLFLLLLLVLGTSLLKVRNYRNRRSTGETELWAFGIQLHFACLPSFPTETLKETEDQVTKAHLRFHVGSRYSRKENPSGLFFDDFSEGHSSDLKRGLHNSHQVDSFTQIWLFFCTIQVLSHSQREDLIQWTVVGCIKSFHSVSPVSLKGLPPRNTIPSPRDN